MTELLIKFLAAGGIMAALDYIWLGLIAKKLYYAELGRLLLDKPNMAAAVAFYIIYVIGVVLFVISPAVDKESWRYALGYGAAFGLVAYATYDLTNLATMKDFSVKIAAIDIAWGIVLTAVVAVGAYFAVKVIA